MEEIFRMRENSPLRISTFGEDGEGNLYVADYASGTVYEIAAK